MERREKKARLDTLNELKRIRQGGGNRLERFKEDDIQGEEETVSVEEEDYDDFIIEDEQTAPIKSSSFSFKPKPTFPTNKPKETVSREKDEFFESLINQLDEEISSEEQQPESDNVFKNENSILQTAPTSELTMEKMELDAPVEGGMFDLKDANLNQFAMEWSDGIISMDEEEEKLFNKQKEEDNEAAGEKAKVSKSVSFEELNVVLPVADSINTFTSASSTLQLPSGESVDFYWIDAFEKMNGTVYLFGKVSCEGGGFASCCVAVTGIKRNVLFLPRENDPSTNSAISFGDIKAEVNKIVSTHKISGATMKKVCRKYCFEIEGVPCEADYLKLSYPYTEPPLPRDLKGNTFSNVFGCNTSALELLLVKRKIMGPCWLRLVPSGREKRNISWCKLEIEVNNPKLITPIINNAPLPPPLTVLSLSIRTIVEPESKTHEIVCASGLLYQNIPTESSSQSDGSQCNAVFSVARDPQSTGFTAKFTDTVTRLHEKGRLELVKNERALLSYLITMIHRADPDVIVGHNFLGFDLGVLLHRMRANKVDFWSRIGRLNWSQWPKQKGNSTEASWAERQIVSGRLICDTYLCAKDLVRSKNYQLQTLVDTLLSSERRFPLDYDQVASYFDTAEQLVYLIKHAEKDSHFQANIMFQLMVLPLTKQLTNIAGNLWSRTLMGARAERNEYLLLHEFHQLKYICPDRSSFKEQSTEKIIDGDDGGDEGEDGAGVGGKGHSASRRKATYAGGLVLEPKKGLYDNIVLLLDFNSLYPSIIQEFNICFTTVERDNNSDEMPAVPSSSLAQGVLPRLLANIVARRRSIKQAMKNPKLSPSEYGQYHIRQQALKLTANSMYGCLGFTHSRFYARPLAMMITGKGREILANTVTVAKQDCNLDVVYGDTDSVMIHTGTREIQEARNMGNLLKKKVNERYRLLEIEMDGIFERLLLLKKKKYAAVIIEEKADGSVTRRMEMKGLDLVRRDWCPLSVDTSNAVLQQILGLDNNGSIIPRKGPIADVVHDILKDVSQQVHAGEISLDSYVISKNLTKDPESYHDARTQPHVTVAMRLRQRSVAIKAGDTIPYVICKSSTSSSSSCLADNAFHPDEVTKDNLTVDWEWYLAQQVHPCVSRLCEHLPGVTISSIAASLSLDTSKYQTRSNDASALKDDNAAQLNVILSGEERFRNVKGLLLTCPECHVKFEFIKSSNPNIIECPHNHSISPLSVYYQALSAIRRDISQYYLGWLQCDEVTCGTVTRQPALYEGRCVSDQCRGSMKPVYTAAMLHRQLSYYFHLFSSPTETANRPSNEVELIKTMISQFMAKSAYSVINLAEIFSFVKVEDCFV